MNSWLQSGTWTSDPGVIIKHQKDNVFALQHYLFQTSGEDFWHLNSFSERFLSALIRLSLTAWVKAALCGDDDCLCETSSV